jgi:chromosomal replication initiator protein
VDRAEPAKLWEGILERLKGRVSQEAYNTWLAPTKGLELRESTLLVEVPNNFFLEWIGQYYAKDIEESIVSESIGPLKVALKSSGRQEPAPLGVRKRQRLVYAKDGSKIQERYTFENFIVGESNRFAHAAALAVAEAPAEAYNPLFIYGGVGLGKTHLMQAIGNYLKRQKEGLNIYYVPAENLFIELIDAIEKGTRLEFKEKYRNKDVLLIDDIHYLKGKESLQEEVFHTFNYLYGTNKQIVFSSDRPPKEIPTLEERLSSRFQGGLVVDIQPPDLETRMAILRRRGEAEGYTIPQDVAYFIADRVKSNIRELEGCLIRLLAKTSLENRTLTVDLAEEMLRDLISGGNHITKDAIMKRACQEFGVSIAELKSRKRTQELAFARQVAMFMMRSLLEISLKEIGESFGGKDHTTVIHACDKIAQLKESDPNFAQRLKNLTSGIKSG